MRDSRGTETGGPKVSVPRVLHRVWLGPDPIPDEAERFWEAWRTLLPGWQHVTWTEASVGLWPLENQELYQGAERLTSGNVWQLRSDLVRYEILWRHAGVYVDCDMEPLRSIEPLLPGVSCFAGWEEQGKWVNNAILGATRHHPFIRRLIAGARASVTANAKKRPNHSTGPRFVTQIYRQHPDELHVFDRDIFYPYAHDELWRAGEVFPNAYTVHHWNNQRNLKGVPLGSA